MLKNITFQNLFLCIGDSSWHTEEIAPLSVTTLGCGSGCGGSGGGDGRSGSNSTTTTTITTTSTSSVIIVTIFVAVYCLDPVTA